MPELTAEQREQATATMRQGPVADLIRLSGIRLDNMPVLRDSLRDNIARWTEGGRDVQLETARWLERRLESRHRHLVREQPGSPEVQSTACLLGRIRRRRESLEAEARPPRAPSVAGQVPAQEEQRASAPARTPRAGRGREGQLALEASVMERYGSAIASTPVLYNDSRGITQQRPRTAQDFLRDAIRVATAGVDAEGRPRRVDLGPASNEYEAAVQEFASELNRRINTAPGSTLRERTRSAIVGMGTEAARAARERRAAAEQQAERTREARQETFTYDVRIPLMAEAPDMDRAGFSYARGYSYRFVSTQPLTSYQITTALNSANPMEALAALGVTQVTNTRNPAEDSAAAAASLRLASNDPLGGLLEVTQVRERPGQPRRT